jgi:hypothetical protein
MQLSLSPIERGLLVGAVTELEKLQRTPMASGYGYGELNRVLKDASAGVVRCNAAAWLGDVSDSARQRMAVSRAYMSFERRGLVQRVACGVTGSQTTHLQLTEAGITLARQLRDQWPSDG